MTICPSHSIRGNFWRGSGLSCAGAPVAEAPPAEVPQALMFEGWRLDMARRQLFAPDGAPRSLTSGEFNILSIFCQHSRKVLSRDDLLDLLHGRAAAVFDRSIDVQISRLRRKIETNLKDPSFIKTVRYGGYFFTPQVTATADNCQAQAAPDASVSAELTRSDCHWGGSPENRTAVAGSRRERALDRDPRLVHPFVNCRDTLAAADAHRYQRVAAVDALQLVQRLHRQDRTGRADRMTQ